MRKLFCNAIIALIVACAPSLAFAMTLSPSGDQVSGYLTTGNISVTPGVDGWISVESPTQGECYVGYGNGGYNWGVSADAFTFGHTGAQNGYIDDTGAHGTTCNPGSAAGHGVTDWSADGTWKVRIYTDSSFTTIAEEVDFCQGDCGGGSAVVTSAEHVIHKVDLETIELVSTVLVLSTLAYVVLRMVGALLSRG